MNIVTNKDVFSDNGQNLYPKKNSQRRGRPRKASLPLKTEDLPTSTVPLIPPTPARPALTIQPSPSLAPTPATVPVPTSPRPPRKMSFYQAARPRSQAPTSTPPVPPVHPSPRILPPAAPRPIHRPVPPPIQAVNRATAPTLAPAPLPLPSRANPNAKVRIIPLGGLEEIGKNMTILEYGNDIIIVDMGFLFPDSDMLGVDYIIPDVSYLDDKKDRIRGVVITHGHLDHIGAVPYLIERLGFPAMYGTPITMGMVEKRLEEFSLIGKNKLVTIQPEKDVLQLGAFRVRPFRLIHSVPGAIGLEIETPNGRIVYTTDWKFDYTPANADPIDFRVLAAVGSRGVDLLFSDSTNADRPGHSISEKVVESALRSSVDEATGRVIIAMFSSDLSRMQMAINAAAANNRKVVVQGRSMQNNLEMAIGLKAMNIPPHTIISEREMNHCDDKQLLILCTGAQGEERSALTRMAKGEHRTIKIKPGDLAILSASPIPGNERSISGVMEALYKAGANVIYNKILDVHTSGHAYQEDLKLMAALMRPHYFMPIHGERSRRILHGKLVQEAGVKKENILIADNGTILELNPDHTVSITNEHVPAGYVIVDGLGVGDIGTVVLRDRQAMAHDGIFVIITVFDKKKKVFLTSPDIISRGFIYMRENEHFVNDIRTEIKKFLTKGNKDDINALKNDLRDYISKLLYQKTEREPIVIPVIIEV